ncbi:hypothetical protein H5410_037735 [Solanum commersonii]|uniref:Uncharacterized protein n=1 Tax=Solanum commersonii TaxID=4109 RepID=A0A9J5Y9A6_SOLCO|nr:hypothetical protein H5410_037735 [Solanum commersonii]
MGRIFVPNPVRKNPPNSSPSRTLRPVPVKSIVFIGRIFDNLKDEYVLIFLWYLNYVNVVYLKLLLDLHDWNCSLIAMGKNSPFEFVMQKWSYKIYLPELFATAGTSKLTEGDQRFYSSTEELFLREARDIMNGGRS